MGLNSDPPYLDRIWNEPWAKTVATKVSLFLENQAGFWKVLNRQSHFKWNQILKFIAYGNHTNLKHLKFVVNWGHF